MVIVNTVVIVKGLGLSQRDVALTLAAFGGGSITAALVLPRLLDRVSDRRVMMIAAIVLTLALSALAALSFAMESSAGYWHVLLAGWLLMGFAYSASVTPSGRLLRRSSNADDRPALFAAQFALSHVCWLICYPLAGQLGARVGMAAAFGGMAVLAAVGTAFAMRLWPSHDLDIVPHEHEDLADDHEHLRLHEKGGHAFVIDKHHSRWPEP